MSALNVKMGYPLLGCFMCCSVYECNFFGKTIEWTVRGGLIKSKSCELLHGHGVDSIVLYSKGWLALILGDKVFLSLKTKSHNTK